MNFTLTTRDKKLLLILLVVAIICIPYFFLIQPSMEKCASLQDEISEYRSKKTTLESYALNKKNYEEEMDTMAAQKEDLMKEFPSELLQEQNVIFAKDTEDVIGISLWQIDYADTDLYLDLQGAVLPDGSTSTVTSASETEATTAEETAAAADGTEASTDETTNDSTVGTEPVETTVLSNGLTGRSTETKYAFDAGYEEFKNFISYIENYESRMVLTGIDVTYDMDRELVSGTFTLKQYALSGEGREPEKTTEPQMLTGTTNVFKQATGNFGTDTESSSPDFFLMLNQSEADVDAVIFGQSNDGSQDSYLTETFNKSMDATITFNGEEGAYTANYSIGDKTLDEGISFTKDGNINFEVISSTRVGKDDKVGVNLSIVNNTDTTVKVSISEDDETNPRVTIKGKTGRILMNQG